MRPFRFRAEAALQLRRREHDHALARLARTQTALTLAQHDLDAAEREIAHAEEALKNAHQDTAAAHQLEWYRSWRLRWAAERHRREEQRRAREVEVNNATRTVTMTHRRVRSLERLQELALSAWHRDAAREERNTMDALAMARYARRKESA